MATTKQFYDYVLEKIGKCGNVRTKMMMGEYLIYFEDVLVGGFYDNMLLLKRTDTTDTLLKDCELRYPYDGSKKLMYVVDNIENVELIERVLLGMVKDLRSDLCIKSKKKMC